MEWLGDDRKLSKDTTPRAATHSPARDHTKETVVKMSSLTRFFRRRRTYRNVVHELAGYSDHELHDIGIDRVDIREIARRMSEEGR
jgi:uncharacterized protein YjiS (DUF1127 family)